MKNIFRNIALILSLTLIFCGLIYAQSGTTQYVYDQNGRLHAVISPSGETTLYEYDAAGNILSIARQNQPVFSVSGFTPAREFTGNEIAIQGTGFIPDASQNQVKFNGVDAVVTSATVNELTAVVPAAATAGKIAVSNLNGSAESFQDFTPLRTITPNAPPKTLNFNSANKNYVFKFAGISGKKISLLFRGITSVLQISVVSPTGITLISSTYGPAYNTDKIFFDQTTLSETGDYEIEINSDNVVNTDFSLYQFDDIAGAIPTDETPLNIEITQPGQNAYLNLDVSQTDQPAFLNITGAAITSFYIIVRSPNGAIVKADYSVTPNKIIRLENLPAAGIYKVEFNPENDASGAVSIDYSLNASNSIVIDGPALSFTIYGNQTGRVEFAGNAGQRVFIKLDSGPFYSVNVKIIKPDGAILDNGATDSRTSAIDINALPDTGTYRIIIDPLTSYGGDITISAASTASVGGDCNSGGRICYVKEIFAVPDQAVDLNLEVIAGGGPPPNTFVNNPKSNKKYSVNSPSSFAPVDVEFSLSEVNVTGQAIVFDNNNNQIGSFNITAASPVITFGSPGFYRLRIVPAAGQSGSFKFRIRNLSQPPPGS